eukprot:1104526-Prorocentrum_minimum.AAC.2
MLSKILSSPPAAINRLRGYPRGLEAESPPRSGNRSGGSATWRLKCKEKETVSETKYTALSTKYTTLEASYSSLQASWLPVPPFPRAQVQSAGDGGGAAGGDEGGPAGGRGALRHADGAVQPAGMPTQLCHLRAARLRPEGGRAYEKAQ